MNLKNPTKCIHALASYFLVGLEAGLRKGQTPKPAFLYNRLVGLMYYPQRFRDRYVHGDDPLPYFVPPLTASTIRSYSVRRVPSHLCLALVIQPQSYPPVARVIACSMIITLLMAGFFGALIPIVLTRLNADPAVGSPVVLTTITDVFGFLSFLGLASIFLIH